MSESSSEIDLDVIDGSLLRVGDAAVEQIRDYEGTITGLAGDMSGEPGRSELVLDVPLPEDGSLDGKAIYVRHPSGLETVYLMRANRGGKTMAAAFISPICPDSSGVEARWHPGSDPDSTATWTTRKKGRIRDAGSG